MKKRTRVLSAVLAVIMLIAMVSGCAAQQNGNSSSGNKNSANTAGGTLKLGIFNHGYGDEFLYKLAEAFTAKTGIDTVVDKSSSAAGWVNSAVLSGAENNDIDVFFDINPTAMSHVAVKNYLKGYERAYVDLSDIYDSKLEGYDTDKTLEELAYDYSMRACTWGGKDAGYGDGKQYFVNWAAGIEGIVYNVDLFEKYNLEVPKTTNEMFEVMEKMKTISKGTYAKNEDGYIIYPFTYSGKVNYLNYPYWVWWAQYDGIETFENAREGKDANGNYSAQSAKTEGKLSAMQIVAKMLDEDNKYADPDSQGRSFTDAQVLFLAGQAFMMSTGDWLEREMSANFNDSININFMPIPLNSDMVIKCDSVKTDEQLSEVVSYIDGDTKEKPSYVSDKDLAYIKSARSMYNSEGNQHIAYIPAYSDQIDAGKQFLQFMLSKEGQEIMLQYAYGNMAMINVDITKFDYYESLSPLQQSKFAVLNKGGEATLTGMCYTHPMNYAGGAGILYGNSLESMFGVSKQSKSFKTPLEAFQEQAKLAGDWSEKMKKAGVTN